MIGDILLSIAVTGKEFGNTWIDDILLSSMGLLQAQLPQLNGLCYGPNHLKLNGPAVGLTHWICCGPICLSSMGPQ